jgi:hypothetical protein
MRNIVYCLGSLPVKPLGQNIWFIFSVSVIGIDGVLRYVQYLLVQAKYWQGAFLHCNTVTSTQRASWFQLFANVRLTAGPWGSSCTSCSPAPRPSPTTNPTAPSRWRTKYSTWVSWITTHWSASFVSISVVDRTRSGIIFPDPDPTFQLVPDPCFGGGLQARWAFPQWATGPCSYWLRQTQLNEVGLVLIGFARLSRIHFQVKNLLNSYRAGAHSNLVTLGLSALFSVP